MKSVKQLFLGLLLLSSLSSDAFAKDYGTGYVWIAGANYGYDSIDYADDKTKYVLKADLKNGLPDINSVITIEAKNRIYYDIRIVQAISKEYLVLLKEKKCESGLGSFTSFMTNSSSLECTVDSVLKNVKTDYVLSDIFSLYNELLSPRKAKVLGYVFIGQGVFMTVQIWR